VPGIHLSVTSQSPASPSGGSLACHGLRRVLGLRDLVLLILGTVIGSGIFLVPGVVLKDVGNSLPLALSVWLLGGVLSLLGALTYGELSATKPEAGGLYVYIRDCFGRFPAFLFGWVLFLVVSTGSGRHVSGCVQQLSRIVPQLDLGSLLPGLRHISSGGA
jgi:amino acid transporter